MSTTRPDPAPRIILGLSRECWLMILALALLAVLLLGPQIEQVTESKRRELRRHAERIVQTYLVGRTAGVPWPEGSVAAKVDAVVTGRLPASGVFVNRLFRATVPEEHIDDLYAYIGSSEKGLLFFDPKGAQSTGGM